MQVFRDIVGSREMPHKISRRSKRRRHPHNSQYGSLLILQFVQEVFESLYVAFKVDQCPRGTRRRHPHKSRISDPLCWILYLGSRIQAPGSGILDPGSWILDPLIRYLLVCIRCLFVFIQCLFDLVCVYSVFIWVCVVFIQCLCYLMCVYSLFILADLCFVDV